MWRGGRVCNWAEITLVKTSGAVTKDREKLTNS